LGRQQVLQLLRHLPLCYVHHLPCAELQELVEGEAHHGQQRARAAAQVVLLLLLRRLCRAAAG
jgi:hypothetical protein